MKYFVAYFRMEAEVTDGRYFKDLQELQEWFERQNKLEKTIILRIEKED